MLCPHSKLLDVMFINMKVLLVSILFSASLALSREIPTKDVETSLGLPVKYTFSDFVLPGIQRKRRNSEVDTTGHYDVTYKQDDFKPLGQERFKSERHCRCPQEQWRGRWYEYPPYRGYGYGGSSRGNRYSPFGSSYGYRYGYPSRMRGSSSWFDERDDYPDDILVYRFYNGGIRPGIGEVGNIPGPIGYLAQQVSSGPEAQRERSVLANTGGIYGYALQYQSYKPVDNDNYRSSSSIFESQGARPIGTGSGNSSPHEFVYSEESSEHSLEGDFAEYELNDKPGSFESASVEHGGYPVTQGNGSNPQGKVRTFRYWAGIWEDENGDENRTPQTVINTGSIRRTEKFLFGTTTPRPQSRGGYRYDDCCYQRRGYRGRGNRHNKKPINFFGITWSKLLDYSDVTDEVDFDEKNIYVDIDKDEKQIVTNSDKQITVAGKEFIRKETEMKENAEVTEKIT